MAGRHKRMALASAEERQAWVEDYNWVWLSRSKRVRRNRRRPYVWSLFNEAMKLAFPQEAVERRMFESSPVLNHLADNSYDVKIVFE